MKIKDINIGSRHRKDLGNIQALADSIKTVGLLQAVVIDCDCNLIAGQRRLEAAKVLGWSQIETRVVDGLEDACLALIAERDENTCRKDFSPSEAAALAEKLEPSARKSAKERQGERTDKHPVKITGSSEQAQSPNGRAADKVAEAVGMSRPTLEKAKAVVEAARNHPEHYEDIREEMDTTGKVAPAYAKLAERQEQPEKPKVRLPHKTAPTWEWSKAIQTIFETLSIVKKRGGIVAVVKEWDRDEREDYLRVMKHVRDQFNEFIPIVEKELA